jgi:SAM-dependent methyltransferase
VLPVRPPALADHFRREGLLGVLRRGHPYDALETYEVLRALYGYSAAYVNYGLWEAGAGSVEPGRRLAEVAADALALEPGGRLLDVGSGLGQAAIDLARRHDLARVLGVNRSERQVGYANALARAEGLEARVEHEVGDATDLGGLAAGSYDAVLALECAGHFTAPDAFLGRARRALRAGGRIALTLNVAGRPTRWFERALFRRAYGFVPASATTWTERLARAGFVGIERRDLTERTIAAAADVCLARLARPSPELRRVAWSTRAWVGLLLRLMRRAIRSGALRYELLSAAKPPG